MVTTEDMIRAARDAFGMYLKDGVRTPRANRTIAPVKIPKMKIIKIILINTTVYYDIAVV